MRPLEIRPPGRELWEELHVKCKCQAQDLSSSWFLILLLTMVKDHVVVANHDVAPTSPYLSPLSYIVAETSPSTYFE